MDATRKQHPLPFHKWMRMVDRAVGNKVGLSAFDLPDCPFADWHEDGLSPQHAARRAIQSANGEL
jgi:hypothetical protein